MKNESETSNGGHAWCLDRRGFLKTGAFLGGSAFFAGQLQRVMEMMGTAESQALAADFAYPLAKPHNIRYSVGLQGNTGCGIKAKIVDGVVVNDLGLDPASGVALEADRVQ